MKEIVKYLNSVYHKRIPYKHFVDISTERGIIKLYESLLSKSTVPSKSLSGSLSLTKEVIIDYIQTLKEKYNVRVYTPYKYFEGLTTKRQIHSRFLDILKGKSSDSRDPKAYTPFKTDKNQPTKKSNYTKAFESKYGSSAKSLNDKAQKTGIPLSILKEVFRKGKAAWRTGHRPGATEDQWGYARVHSFITLGCAAMGADFYLIKKAVKQMSEKDIRKWFSSPILCPKKTLEKDYYRKFGAKEYIKNYFSSKK